MSMIHKFSMDGNNIVLDVNGGGVHVLDDVAYDLVDLFEEKSMEEIVDSLNKDYTKYIISLSIGLVGLGIIIYEKKKRK